LGLLNNPKILRKLSIYQLLVIGSSHTHFIPTLLTKPNALAILKNWELHAIAMANETFALNLLDNPEILRKLSPKELLDITYSHPHFIPTLLTKPNALAILESSKLSEIAKAIKEFALMLLNTPKLLKKQVDIQLHGIIQTHTDDLKYQLMEKLESLNTDAKNNKHKNMDFTILKDTTLCHLLLSNTTRRLNKFNEDSLISQECFQNITACENFEKLEQILKEEYKRLQRSASISTHFYSLFHKPSRYEPLENCLLRIRQSDTSHTNQMQSSYCLQPMIQASKIGHG